MIANNYDIITVTSADSSIRVDVAWSYTSLGELYLWQQNNTTGDISFSNLSQFTVTINEDESGKYLLVQNIYGVEVTLKTARITAMAQLYTLANGGALNPGSLIQALDDVTKISQEISKGYEGQGITSVNNFEILDKVARANSILGFDENGAPNLSLSLSKLFNMSENMTQATLDEIDAQLPGAIVAELDEYAGFYYETVAAMKAATISVGKKLSTKGYYAAGDGGGASYLIVSPQAFDGYGDHEVTGGNIAVLQTSSALLADQWGAQADPVDSLAVLQAMSNYLYSIGGGEIVLNSNKQYFCDSYIGAEVNGTMCWNTLGDAIVSKILLLGKNTTLRGDSGVVKIKYEGGSSSPFSYSTSANILSFPGEEDLITVSSTSNSGNSATTASTTGLSVGQVVNLARLGGQSGGIPNTPSQERSPQQFLTIKTITGAGPYTIAFEESFEHNFESAQGLSIYTPSDIADYPVNVYLKDIEFVGGVADKCYVLISRTINAGFDNVTFTGANFGIGMSQKIKCGKIKLEHDLNSTALSTIEATSDVMINEVYAEGRGNTHSLGCLFITDGSRKVTINKLTARDFTETGFACFYGFDVSIGELNIVNCGENATYNGFKGAFTCGFPALGAAGTKELAESDQYKLRNTGKAYMKVGKLSIKGSPTVPVRYHDVELTIDSANIEWAPSVYQCYPFYGGESGERRSDITHYPDGGLSSLRVGEARIYPTTASNKAFSGANGFSGLFRKGITTVTSSEVVGASSITVADSTKFKNNITVYVAPELGTGNAARAYIITSITGNVLTISGTLSDEITSGAGIWTASIKDSDVLTKVTCDNLRVDGMETIAPRYNSLMYPDHQTGVGPYTTTFDIFLPSYGTYELTAVCMSGDYYHYEENVYKIVWDETGAAFPIEEVTVLSSVKERTNATVDSCTISGDTLTITLGSATQGKSTASYYYLRRSQLNIVTL